MVVLPRGPLRSPPLRPVPWIACRAFCRGCADFLRETRARLSGQISAWCDVRLQQWVRVDDGSNASDHCKTHVLTLVEGVAAL